MQDAAMPVTEPTFVDSEAFKVAVAESVRSTIAAEMAKMKGAPESGDLSEMHGLFKALAVNIANMSTQGTGQMKPVSPDVMAFREAARKKMYDILNKAYAAKTWPSYELTGQIYINGQIVEPVWEDPKTKLQKNTEIDFYGEPNLAMVPLNDLAKQVHRAYLDSVGDEDDAAPKYASPWAQIGNQTILIKNGEEGAVQTPPDENASLFRITSQNGKSGKPGKAILGTIFPHVTDSSYGAGA